MKTIHIIGVPLDLGAGRRGVDMGPSALRIASLGERISALGYPVVDRGNVAAAVPETKARGHERKRYIREISRVCTRLYQTTTTSLDDGALPIVLGGDHSLSAGSVAAAAAHARRTRKKLGVIWVDAHGDMNTPESTTSGNVHGMPLAALLGPEPAELSGIAGFSPTLSPVRTVLLGVRNLDPAEKRRVRDSGIHVFTMNDIDRDGLPSVAKRAILLAGGGGAVVHVSLDMDVCDPTIAPGVGTPVKGGLNYREAHMLMEMVAASGKLGSLDVVEVNPILDTRNSTAQLGVELLLSALGKTIL